MIKKKKKKKTIDRCFSQAEAQYIISSLFNIELHMHVPRLRKEEDIL
jgi:hypothetical protein